MRRDVPTFDLPADSRWATCIGPKWELVPLRIPGGWGVRHNGIDARRLPSGRIECNDSEDLFWAVKLPPSDKQVYDKDPASPWREMALDAGWYRDHFRIVMLDPDWDNIRRSFRTPSFEEFVLRLETWLLEIVCHGDVRVYDAPRE